MRVREQNNNICVNDDCLNDIILVYLLHTELHTHSEKLSSNETFQIDLLF